MSCPNPIEVAASWGVMVEHVDGLRRVRQLDPVVAADLVRYLGGDPEEARQDVAASILTVRGDEPVAFADKGELVLANGQMVAVSPDVPTTVPVGYHRFYPTGSMEPVTVVGSPAVAAPTPGRGWGLSVQPYALRSSQDWGIGDLGTVRDLARWAAQQGATTLLLGPMLAAAPTTPREPSPYYPATRLFLDPLYLSTQDVRAPDGTPVAVSRPAGLSDSADAPIDRDAVHTAKYATLRALWTDLDGSPDPLLQDFLAASALPVQLFATWCVLTDKLGGDWRQWPTELQDPRSAQVEAFAEQHADDVSFHVWLQWMCEQQMARIAGEIDVINDLPVGFDPGGFDGWLWQEALVPQVRIGAPPDGFAPDGHGWDSAPFSPMALERLRFAPLVAVWRANMARGAGLHLDHAMHLTRLFWVPWDRTPAEGAYVEYPFREILDLLVLESVANSCYVVTEDLGNVPSDFRQQIGERGLLRTIILWFVKIPPNKWPEAAVAYVSNHDHPPVAAVWADHDAGARLIDVDPQSEEAFARLSHHQRLVALGEGTPVDADLFTALRRTHEGLGRSGAGLVLSQVLDLMLGAQRVNSPTGDRSQSWRTSLPMLLDDLVEDEVARELCSVLAAARNKDRSDFDLTGG